MAKLTLHSIRLSSLPLAAALALAAPALAGDVSLKLAAGTGFSIQNSTGIIERLRVDEATGNVSRNGALFVHTTGTNNLFVGAGAGNPTTTGSGGNTAVGYRAVYSNTTGFSNSAFGDRASFANTTGYSNSAFGSLSLVDNVSGNGNSAFGAQALHTNTTGSHNSAVGSYALYFNTTGNRNVAFGFYAGQYQTTGSDNIYLANPGVAGESGRIRIGTNLRHTATFIAGINGTNVGGNALPVYVNSSGQLGTSGGSQTLWTGNMNPNDFSLAGRGSIQLHGIDQSTGSLPTTAAVTITGGTHQSGLDLRRELTGFVGEYMMRVQVPNEGGWQDTVAYFNNGGHFFTTGAITASGTTSTCRGAVSQPSADINCRIVPPDIAMTPSMNYQIGAWADVAGPTFLARRTSVGETNYEGMDRNGNVTFRADEYGTLRLKPQALDAEFRPGFGSFYTKTVAGEVSQPYYVDGAGTITPLGDGLAKHGLAMTDGVFSLAPSNAAPSELRLYEDADLGSNYVRLVGVETATDLTGNPATYVSRLSSAAPAAAGARGPVIGAVSNGNTFDTPAELCGLTYAASAGVAQTCVAGSAKKFGTSAPANNTVALIGCSDPVAAGVYFEVVCNVE